VVQKQFFTQVDSEHLEFMPGSQLSVLDYNDQGDARVYSEKLKRAIHVSKKDFSKFKFVQTQTHATDVIHILDPRLCDLQVTVFDAREPLEKANGDYIRQSDNSYKNMKTNGIIWMDNKSWKLSTDGQASLHYDFQWEAEELSGDMIWKSKDGKQSCSVLKAGLKAKDGVPDDSSPISTVIPRVADKLRCLQKGLKVSDGSGHASLGEVLKHLDGFNVKSATKELQADPVIALKEAIRMAFGVHQEQSGIQAGLSIVDSVCEVLVQNWLAEAARNEAPKLDDDAELDGD